MSNRDDSDEATNQLQLRLVRGADDSANAAWQQFLDRNHLKGPPYVKAGVMGSRRPDVAGSSRLFFRAGEVSRMVGVAEHVLRYWESEFPQLTPHRNRAGQRVYQLRDVYIVFRIHELLYDYKCTLADARDHLGDIADTTLGTLLDPNEAG